MRTQQSASPEEERELLWYRTAPTPALEVDRGRLGLFGRMFDTPCLVDFFHAGPSVNDVLYCISKQLEQHRVLIREAVQQYGAAAEDYVAVPPLWIMSPRAPEETMSQLDFEPMEGWASGFWQWTTPKVPVRVVILCEVPETRDTLMLRILGRGQTFYRAIHDLYALPDDAWEARQLIPSFLNCRTEYLEAIRDDKTLGVAELQTIEAMFDEWQIRFERQNRLQQRRGELCRMYLARFGELPSEVQAAIESMEDDAALQQWVEPFAIGTPEEIASLVLGRR